MKHIIFIIVSITGALVFYSLGYLFATTTLTKELLKEHDEIARDNFDTALSIFGDGFTGKRIVFYGGVGERRIFELDGYVLSVIPAYDTRRDKGSEDKYGFNDDMSNFANHLNKIAVVLACHWKINGDKNGDKLLGYLTEVSPLFKISNYTLPIITLENLPASDAHVQSLASQWEWMFKKANIKGPGERRDKPDQRSR